LEALRSVFSRIFCNMYVLSSLNHNVAIRGPYHRLGGSFLVLNTGRRPYHRQAHASQNSPVSLLEQMRAFEDVSHIVQNKGSPVLWKVPRFVLADLHGKTYLLHSSSTTAQDWIGPVEPYSFLCEKCASEKICVPNAHLRDPFIDAQQHFKTTCQ